MTMMVSSSSPQRFIRMLSLTVVVAVVGLCCPLEGVSAFSLMANPYQEPTELDGRSPCPALNTLANHGLIPRNGKDVSVKDLAIKAAEAYSMSNESTAFVVEKMISIGLPHRIDETNDDILFDLDDAHVVDRDISTTWLDRYFRTVSELNPCLIDNLIALAGDGDYITPDMVEENLRNRYEDSSMFNPNFKFTEHTLEIAGVQSAELFVVSDDPTLQTVNKTVLYDFLRYNRFSDGYVPRATMNPFQPKLDDTDPSSQLIHRFTNVLKEISQDDGGGVAIQRSATHDHDHAVCVDEQPPAPPTMAPAPTTTPRANDVDSAAAVTTRASFVSLSFLLGGAAMTSVMMTMVTMF